MLAQSQNGYCLRRGHDQQKNMNKCNTFKQAITNGHKYKREEKKMKKKYS